MIAAFSRIAVLLMVLLTVAPALASSTTTTKGAVKKLDTVACTVTLSDNTVYQFGKHCDFSKLKLGEQIAIVWKSAGNVRNAVQVFVAM